MIATSRAKVESLKIPLASIKKRRDEALTPSLESVLNPGGLKQTRAAVARRAPAGF